MICLSRTVSEINGDIRRQHSPIFPTHPVYLTSPMKEFPLEFGIGARVTKAYVMKLPEGRKSFKIGFVVLKQYRL